MNAATTTVLSTITPAETGESSTDEAVAPTEGDGVTVAAEAPKAHEPDPRLEIARKLEAAAARESRAKHASAKLSEREQGLTTREKELAERERKLAESEAELEADPVDFYLKRGKDPVEAIKRFAKPQSEEQREIEKLKAERKAERDADEKRRTEWETRQAEDHKQRQYSKFVSETKVEECPFLTTLHPAESVPKLVGELLNEKDGDGVTLLEAFRVEHNRNPSDREIRAALEQRSEVRAKGLYEALKLRFEAPSQSAPEAPHASESTSGPPSLSNAHAGKVISKSGAEKPLTREERLERSRRELRSRVDAEVAAETE